MKAAFLFYLKYTGIKETQIWDTLGTSKMELFVTIGICKVISCRLIMLYTQYCPMSVFIWVSSLLVPFNFRWLHLQPSEMVVLVTTTVANIVFYWTMVLHAHFFPMKFLFFVSVLCWIHLVTDNSTLFQVVPGSSTLFQGDSSSFQLVSVCSTWFQFLPRFSMYAVVVSLLMKLTNINIFFIFVFIFDIQQSMDASKKISLDRRYDESLSIYLFIYLFT